jgi:hypothetical protein
MATHVALRQESETGIGFSHPKNRNRARTLPMHRYDHELGTITGPESTACVLDWANIKGLMILVALCGDAQF